MKKNTLKGFIPLEVRHLECLPTRFKEKRVGPLTGFTIIETLIAITILTFAMMGPLTAVYASLNISEGSQDQLTATYLAQEAIEYVRAKRADNYMNDRDWLDGMSTCSRGDTCIIDASMQDFGMGVESCGSSPYWGVCPRLYLSDDHFYTEQQIGALTPFTRSVQNIDVVGDDYQTAINVEATVTWTKKGVGHSVVLKETLQNWK
jgi:type II secretory pathway pseudopilin PulG